MSRRSWFAALLGLFVARKIEPEPEPRTLSDDEPLVFTFVFADD